MCITDVIDSESLYAFYKKKSVSKDYKNPTTFHQSYGFIIAQKKFVKYNVATAVLVIRLQIGDSIRSSAIFETKNFENYVVLYGKVYLYIIHHNVDFSWRTTG